MDIQFVLVLEGVVVLLVLLLLLRLISEPKATVLVPLRGLGDTYCGGSSGVSGCTEDTNDEDDDHAAVDDDQDKPSQKAGVGIIEE